LVASLVSFLIGEIKQESSYQKEILEFSRLILKIVAASIVFDTLFFLVFRANPNSLMRTLWMIGGVLTEVVLIFSVRTRHRFRQASPPSLALVGLSLISGLLILVLPFSKLGKDFFFFTTPQVYSLLLVLGLVFLYFVISEGVKLGYYKRRR